MSTRIKEALWSFIQELKTITWDRESIKCVLDNSKLEPKHTIKKILREILTGAKVSPPIDDVVYSLGRIETTRRIALTIFPFKRTKDET